MQIPILRRLAKSWFRTSEGHVQHREQVPQGIHVEESVRGSSLQMGLSQFVDPGRVEPLPDSGISLGEVLFEPILAGADQMVILELTDIETDTRHHLDAGKLDISDAELSPRSRRASRFDHRLYLCQHFLVDHAELRRAVEVDDHVGHRHSHIHPIADSQHELTGHLFSQVGKMFPDHGEVIHHLGLLLETTADQFTNPRDQSLGDRLDTRLIEEPGIVSILPLLSLRLPVIDGPDHHRILSQSISASICWRGSCGQQEGHKQHSIDELGYHFGISFRGNSRISYRSLRVNLQVGFFSVEASNAHPYSVGSRQRETHPYDQ